MFRTGRGFLAMLQFNRAAGPAAREDPGDPRAGRLDTRNGGSRGALPDKQYKLAHNPRRAKTQRHSHSGGEGNAIPVPPWASSVRREDERCGEDWGVDGSHEATPGVFDIMAAGTYAACHASRTGEGHEHRAGDHQSNREGFRR